MFVKGHLPGRREVNCRGCSEGGPRGRCPSRRKTGWGRTAGRAGPDAWAREPVGLQLTFAGVHYSAEPLRVSYWLWVSPESSEILRAPGIEGNRAAEVTAGTRQSCGLSPGPPVPSPGPSCSVGLGKGLGQGPSAELEIRCTDLGDVSPGQQALTLTSMRKEASPRPALGWAERGASGWVAPLGCGD